MLRLQLPVTALLVVTIATGCASESPSDGGPDVLVAEHPSEATREAAVSGTMELNGGCFVLSSEDGDWLSEWPYGSMHGDDARSIEVPSFGTVYPGQDLTGSGGYSANSDRCALEGLQGTVQIDLLTTK